MTTNLTNDAGDGYVKSDGDIFPVQIASAAGSNSQSGSTAITRSLVVVTTVSATTRGVRLPVPTTGRSVTIMNAGGTNNKVYPNAGGRIGAAATNVAVALTKNKSNLYVAQNATTWRVLVGG